MSTVVILPHFKRSSFQTFHEHTRCKLKYRWQQFLKQANQRHIPVSIDLRAYQNLISQRCYYCGQPPTLLRKIGVDRVDSTNVYEPGSVVPSCSTNYMKGTLSKAAFLSQLALIHARHSGSHAVHVNVRHPYPIGPLESAQYWPEYPRVSVIDWHRDIQPFYAFLFSCHPCFSLHQCSTTP
mmetsp:Transcript_23025/g.72169  ORF Transcript_23025/g.72169 Transcript_23025/m.72169 type:complete len:181 (-) Transcript_23025:405-947(-)